MKHRTWPLWLLRDVPAFLGVLVSFWPLMILVIANGAKAMAGKKINPRVYEHLMAMLPEAEARLRYALARQVLRAFGWDPRCVQLEHLPPITSWSDFGPRFEAYSNTMLDLRAAAQIFADDFRRHYRIRTRVDANTVRVARGAPGLRRAARHVLALVASSSLGSAVALNACSAQSVHASNRAGALANARAPPASSQFRQSG